MTVVTRYAKKRKLTRFAADAYGTYRGTRRPTATDVRRAARMIQRGYRAYRRTKKKSRRSGVNRVAGSTLGGVAHQEWLFGDPTSNSNGVEELQRKVCYIREIKPCLPPNQNFTIGAAPAMTYQLSGLKVCGFFQNRTFNGEPVELHWAIIQPQDTDETVDNIKQTFFSDQNASTTRVRAFEESTTNPDWNAKNLCQGINNRNVRVLCHKRFTLGSRYVAGNQQTTRRWYKKVNKYYNFKGKKFSYRSTTSTGAERPLYMCVWWEYPYLPTNDITNFIGCSLDTTGFVRRSSCC